MACRNCQIERRRVEDQTSSKFPDGFCIRNRTPPKDREGYGECKFPDPTLTPTNAAVWNLYQRTYGSANTVGMDGVFVGKRPADVEAVANALGIPWDETTIDKFSLIETMHIQDCHRKYEESRKKK